VTGGGFAAVARPALNVVESKRSGNRNKNTGQEKAMSKLIAILTGKYGGIVIPPGGPFDLDPGELRFVPSRFSYPSTEESWRMDAEAIAGDFSRAIDRFESERAR